MEKEYCRVVTTFSGKNAYDYKVGDKIPTKIEYGRVHNGKFEEEVIVGDFNNIQVHDLVFLIQRGYSREDVIKQCFVDYSTHKLVIQC